MGQQAHHNLVANLPPAFSSLVGREQDISRVANKLCDDHIRLVTLTGSAGVGKTRLAVEVASVVAPTFVDGVWFVDLSSLNESDLVSHAVSLAGGLREQQDLSLLDTLTDALRPQKVLLILDSCEHLVGACATLVGHLYRTCPGLHILITSRQQIGVTGEVTWPVSPLTCPDPSDVLGLKQITDYEAIRMFVERAGTVLPGFQLTDMNQAAVVHICHHLDGIPLALELAARWVTTLSVEQIANRMDDRLQLLSNRDPLAPPRQQTLRDTVQWSYDLLSMQEKTLFNRLSVFAGGCYLDAIEAVCAGDGIETSQVLHLLDRLVVQSLVLAESSQGEMRYRLLETLRLFAREQLVIGGMADQTYQQHAHYYLRLAELAEPHLWEPDGSQWMDRLEVEHENLRAVLRWAVGRGEAETAQRFGAALCRFWRVRGHATEGLRWLERALVWNAGSSATRA